MNGAKRHGHSYGVQSMCILCHDKACNRKEFFVLGEDFSTHRFVSHKLAAQLAVMEPQHSLSVLKKEHHNHRRIER